MGENTKLFMATFWLHMDHMDTWKLFFPSKWNDRALEWTGTDYIVHCVRACVCVCENVGFLMNTRFLLSD